MLIDVLIAGVESSRMKGYPDFPGRPEVGIPVPDIRAPDSDEEWQLAN